jgi:hypothetical protein
MHSFQKVPVFRQLAFTGLCVLGLLAALAAGCAEGAEEQPTDDDGDTTAATGGGGGMGGSGAGAGNAIPSNNFAQDPTSWLVPEAGWTEGFHSANNAASYYHWSTFDIDGDGKLELVHTADPASQQVLGGSANPHWRVYDDDGGGFAKIYSEWSVPTAEWADGFHSVTNSSSSYSWFTMDIDGDGAPELVQTSDYNTGYVFGGTTNPHWRVYDNTGSGFVSGFVEWAVPLAEWTNGFYTLTGLSSGANWSTFDIDGDGAPELVQTSDYTTGAVFDANGEKQWKVFDNMGSGFGTAYVPWKVPTSDSLVDGFTTTNSASGFSKWATINIDGDIEPELVQTADPDTGNVWGAGGEAHWRVYDNGGMGFSDGYLLWKVPNAMWTEGFSLVANVSGFQNWSTFNIDGDGAAELVHTADPDTGNIFGGAAKPHWRIFDNTGSGFEVIHREWTVPQAPWLEGYFSPSNQTSFMHWSVFDIDGDKYPDLVSTADPTSGAVWREMGPVWRVYRGVP